MKRILYLLGISLCVLVRAEAARAQSSGRVVHVFVALADNEHQGIIPVPAALGNGDDPKRNLYWGAAFGVKTFFRKSPDWKQLVAIARPSAAIAERLVLRHQASGTILIADAYRGREIRQAIADFLKSAVGSDADAALFEGQADGASLRVSGPSDLVVYVGHDGLMDFPAPEFPSNDKSSGRRAIVLACASKQYFAPPLQRAKAQPLLWTTNLMAPEAYTLKAALDGWIAHEPDEQIRQRAAAAYSQYQKISPKASLRLFASGW